MKFTHFTLASAAPQFFNLLLGLVSQIPTVDGVPLGGPTRRKGHGWDHGRGRRPGRRASQRERANRRHAAAKAAHRRRAA